MAVRIMGGVVGKVNLNRRWLKAENGTLAKTGKP
jgi:hypothetical protein